MWGCLLQAMKRPASGGAGSREQDDGVAVSGDLGEARRSGTVRLRPDPAGSDEFDGDRRLGG